MTVSINDMLICLLQTFILRTEGISEKRVHRVIEHSGTSHLISASVQLTHSWQSSAGAQNSPRAEHALKGRSQTSGRHLDPSEKLIIKASPHQNYAQSAKIQKYLRIFSGVA